MRVWSRRACDAMSPCSHHEVLAKARGDKFTEHQQERALT